MTTDFEKTRPEYATGLEERIAQLQAQVAHYKPLADKWTPRVSSENILSDGTGHVTLFFGGKQITATISAQALEILSHQDLVTNVSSTLSESLLVDRLREIVAPEVDKLIQSAKSVRGAGKW